MAGDLTYPGTEWDAAFERFVDIGVELAKLQAWITAHPDDETSRHRFDASRATYMTRLRELTDGDDTPSVTDVRGRTADRMIRALAAAVEQTTPPPPPPDRDGRCVHTRAELDTARRIITDAADHFGWPDRPVPDALIWRTGLNLLLSDGGDQQHVYECSDPICDGDGDGEYCRRGGNYYHRHEQAS